MSEVEVQLAELRVQLERQCTWLGKERDALLAGMRMLENAESTFMHAELSFNEALGAVFGPDTRVQLGAVYAQAVSAARLVGEQTARNEHALAQLQDLTRLVEQASNRLSELEAHQ